MIERRATVRNAAGIHCRPSTRIVERARAYQGEMSVHHDEAESDLRSVVGLMSLGLEQGAAVVIRVCGREEDRVCGELVELFETRFDFR